MTEGSGPPLHGVRSDPARPTPRQRALAPEPFPADSPATHALDAPGERRLLWTATVLGAASMALTVAAGLGRTTLVAVALGPAAVGLLGQQASLTVLLSYLTTFGTAGGTTRLLRDAVIAGDEAQAARVLWTSTLLRPSRALSRDGQQGGYQATRTGSHGVLCLGRLDLREAQYVMVGSSRKHPSALALAPIGSVVPERDPLRID